MLKELSVGIVDREYYASEYSSKEDERSIGLFQSFHDAAIIYVQRFAVANTQEHAELPETARLELRRKRLKQSSMAQLNKGTHIGMPAVMS